MTWQDKAACAGMDTELFYSPTITGKEKVKAVCVKCPVRTQCLKAAMVEEAPQIDPESSRMEGAFRNRGMRAGVRGGLTHTERWTLQYPEESEKYLADERMRAARKVEKRVRTPHAPRPARTEAQRALRRERDNRPKVAALAELVQAG